MSDVSGARDRVSNLSAYASILLAFSLFGGLVAASVEGLDVDVLLGLLGSATGFLFLALMRRLLTAPSAQGVTNLNLASASFGGLWFLSVLVSLFEDGALDLLETFGFVLVLAAGYLGWEMLSEARKMAAEAWATTLVSETTDEATSDGAILGASPPARGPGAPISSPLRSSPPPPSRPTAADGPADPAARPVSADARATRAARPDRVPARSTPPPPGPPTTVAPRPVSPAARSAGMFVWGPPTKATTRQPSPETPQAPASERPVTGSAEKERAPASAPDDPKQPDTYSPRGRAERKPVMTRDGGETPDPEAESTLSSAHELGEAPSSEPESSKPVQLAANYCGSCGTRVVTPGHTFCRNCGERL